VISDSALNYESAARSAGGVRSAFTAVTIPDLDAAITHLRDVLSDETYDSLVRKGAAMTSAAMVTYAYDQIDQARAELKSIPE